MSRLLSRENLKLAIVAVACLLLAWTGPSIAHGVHAKFAHNADKVDGKHAVGAGASLNKAKGKLVAHGNQGKLPAKFIPNTVSFPAKVPPGQLITGRWGLDDQGTGASGDWGASISYPARLPSTPTSVQFIQQGGASTTACPGAVLNPKATPGVLCIYVLHKSSVLSAGTTFSTSVFGVTVGFSGTPTGDIVANGTYAYKAPASVSRTRLALPDPPGKG